MIYEVWFRNDWGEAGSSPEFTFATLDMAKLKAIQISTKFATFVLDKNQNPSVVRGFGIKNKWFDAVDCAKCDNWSYTYDVCKACNSASWKHIRV